ncbi:MAG: tetratricopeptide repeat protein, partial [Candidatus Rokubacteria bacterium]|nr:tetratricopeptide repeat protein [Candidatus Rokubacteria bacterium]
MRRLVALWAALWLLWSGLSTAAPLAPLELPAPDLVPLLPLVAPPLDKPPVSVPEPALPDPPEPAPPLPSAPLLVDLSQKPLAPLPPPRMLACNPLGTLLGLASELLECGRARFQRDELEEARAALEAAVRASSDRSLIREARYWLGQTLLRLNRLEEAERTLRRVYQDAPAGEVGLHALHFVGWLSLRLNDPARALGSFEQVIKQSPAAEVVPYARHGRALALYALERYPAAREAWQALSGEAPSALGREVTFWLGESLGRVGEHRAAAEQLRRFTDSGRHPLLEAGILRLGWWGLAAGDHLESVKTFRWLLSAYPRATEGAWARVGLVRALLALD